MINSQARSLKIEGRQDCRGPGGQGLDKVPGSEREAETKVQGGGERVLLGDSGSLPCLIGSESYIISNVERKQSALENPVPGHFKNSKSQPGGGGAHL